MRWNQFVFGYGSLMNARSIRETLVDFAPGTRLIPAKLAGYRREFSVVHANTRNFATESGHCPPQIAYMNVRQVEHCRALGVVFLVSSEDLTRLDLRESGYRREEVTARISFPGDAAEVSAGAARIYTYVGDNPIDPESDSAAIGADYVRVIEDAHREIDRRLGNDEFTADFRQLLAAYAAWPQVVTSNQRNPRGYDAR